MYNIIGTIVMFALEFLRSSDAFCNMLHGRSYFHWIEK
jgi:hypothetical protein